MATSGSKSVKFTDYDTLRWSWSVKSLSPSTNEATIAWKAEIISAEHGRIESTNPKVWALSVMDFDKVQGSEYSGTAYIAVDDYETKEVASGEFTIGHTVSAYGRTSVEFTLELAINFGGNYIQSTKVNCGFTLDAPPKGAMILSATNFTDEQNPSIEYSLDYLSVSTLRASITVGSYTLTRTIPIVSRGSYTFELTQSERNSIARQVTDSLYGKARFTISTSLSGSSIDHSLDKEVRIVNAEPTLAPTYSINGDFTYILAEQNSINVACNATAQKGARIVSQSITCGSKKINAGSGTLTDITVNTINFSAVDSRGVQTATSLTVDMIPYKKLTCNIESTNPVENDDGTVTVRFNISGAFYNGGFNDGGSPNALTLNYRTKIDGTYSEWTWLNSTLRNDSYTASLTFTLRPTQQISVEVQAEDAINSFITTLVSKQLQPVFDWSSTDFNFNVPVSIKGVEIPTLVASGSFSHMPNGTFYWRRWSDGTAECWGSTSFTTAIQTVWVGGMHTSGAISSTEINISPVGFNATPNIVAQLRTRSTGAWLMVPGGTSPASKSSTGMYELVRPAAYSTQSQYTICYDIKGRWK